MAPGTPATVNEQAACGDGVIEIDIDGDIDATTVEKVKGAFDRQRASTMQPASVKCVGRHQINSPGGSISAAMAIGRIFRREKASLQVKDNDVCLSACVLVLAGAVERPISRSAKVGIHRPYLETTSQGSMTADQRETRQDLEAGQSTLALAARCRRHGCHSICTPARHEAALARSSDGPPADQGRCRCPC